MKNQKLFFVSLSSLLIIHYSLVINSALAQTTTPVVTVTTATTVTTSPKGFWGEFRDKFRDSREERKENFKEARTTIKEDREDMRDDIKNIRLSGTPGADRKATVSATRLQFRKDRLTAVYTAIKKNLTERFNLLDVTIKAKVQAKIDAQTSAGKDTTEAKTKMATYSSAAYTSDLAAFDAKYQAALNSAEPKNMLKELNDSAKAVREELSALRKILVDSFRLAVRAK